MKSTPPCRTSSAVTWGRVTFFKLRAIKKKKHSRLGVRIDDDDDDDDVKKDGDLNCSQLCEQFNTQS